MADLDQVVLLDEDGTPTGTADRTGVHGHATPLHLAFSAHILNPRGQVLITRRALSKKTWPGVWTNSCCGHPRPGESIEDAIRRRVREELGLSIDRLSPLLPDFRYQATDASGIVENEICPVHLATIGDDVDPRPDPDEVCEWAWVSWRDLQTAITATPQVFSPWSVSQVRAIKPHQVKIDHGGESSHAFVETLMQDVDGLLTEELVAMAERWVGQTDHLGLDVLPLDLPAWVQDLLVGRGKRIRVRMAGWGFTAAGGTAKDDPGYRWLVKSAAALEALHLFALVHDDVMDESTMRRGRPAAHVEAARWHAAGRGHGKGDHFGVSMAILLGDLAHLLADKLASELPAPLREVWFELCLELIAGQRADLTGAAAGRRDLAHAEYVATTKSGRYTITRPLQLGALAAGGSPETVTSLTDYGDALGQAFALRDDVLGVWGDPDVTGKPAGDDLYEAKATVLLAQAQHLLHGEDLALLTRVGTAGFSREEVATLAEAMRSGGVELAVETLIQQSVEQAMTTLDAATLNPAAASGLRHEARSIAWRSA